MGHELGHTLAPQKEQQRLEALRSYNILYSSAEEAFDEITKMMTQVFGMAMACISLIDEQHVFHKSHTGSLDSEIESRADSIYEQIIFNNRPLIIEDAFNDDLLKVNPSIKIKDGIRFFAGAPIINKDGYALGTVCIFTTIPRSFSKQQESLLASFAKLVMREIKLRQANLKQQIVENQLRLTEERFNLVSKATQDVIWDWNLVTDEIWWNEGFKTVFGYNDVDIEKDVSSWYNRIHPDDREKIVHDIHTVIDAKGKLWSDEYRFRKKDGTYAIVFDRGYTVYDEGGKPYRMLGSMQDVTERRMQQQKIEQSEQRFQAAVAAVQGILWTNDNEGRMNGEQLGWQKLTGQNYNEYTGHGWTSALHPDDVLPTLEAWNESVKARKTFVFEHRVKTSNQQYRIFSVRAIPVFENNGDVKEWVGVHTDVTEQRLVEDKIRQSEKRFHNLVRDATLGIVVVLGDELRIEVVNLAYAKLVGRSLEDLYDRPLFEALPEAEKEFRGIIEKVKTTGQSIYLFDQFYSVNAGTSTISGYLNIVYQPYTELDGEVKGVMILCQDVSAQVVSRKKVAEAEETAKLAIASAELGTFHVDVATNELKASERLKEIFDVETYADRNRYVQAIHPADLDLRNDAYKEARVSGILAYEARVIRKNGLIRWVRVKGRIYFDDQSIPVKIVGVVQDITEEKHFAAELTRQVNERTQEMEQFTYVSHHDLQEPLRKIIIFSDMVRAESYALLPAASKLRIDKIIASASRMSIALKDVLNFASLSKKESFGHVDLNSILSAVLIDLELIISDKSAQVKVSDLPVIEGVPQQMHQLFYNLINNALKFARQDVPTLISVSCKKLTALQSAAHQGLQTDKVYYEIKVNDNGIGFDQEAADKIFVLFQRLHNKDKYQGTGIGLALCKKVVSNHGGQISAEGAHNQGAIFTVILPTDQSFR